jgi:hypothetical protein
MHFLLTCKSESETSPASPTNWRVGALARFRENEHNNVLKHRGYNLKHNGEL